MKKLIWLAVLGVFFFIGGQWLGLNFSEENRKTAESLSKRGDSQKEEPGAQNGGALGAQKPGGDGGANP
jgi:hypothetical protein